MQSKSQKFIYSMILLLVSTFIYPQVLKPSITFDDNPLTHNMGIASDGNFYYTINGGVTHKGQINKYSFDGKLINTYEISLDMRGIFYNKRDKSLYVNCYDKSIYKITDIAKGKNELIIKDFYENEQSSLDFNDSGKLLFCFNQGELKIYKFPKLKLYKKLTGIDYGSGHSNGEAAIAVSKKHFYIWNATEKMIFVYDFKGNKIKTINISDGNYGFTLSYANGLIFVATDGDYDIGTWYGYDLSF